MRSSVAINGAASSTRPNATKASTASGMKAPTTISVASGAASSMATNGCHRRQRGLVVASATPRGEPSVVSCTPASIATGTALSAASAGDIAASLVDAAGVGKRVAARQREYLRLIPAHLQSPFHRVFCDVNGVVDVSRYDSTEAE